MSRSAASDKWALLAPQSLYSGVFFPIILVGEPLSLISTAWIGRYTLDIYGTEAWIFSDIELWLSVTLPFLFD